VGGFSELADGGNGVRLDWIGALQSVYYIHISLNPSNKSGIHSLIPCVQALWSRKLDRVRRTYAHR
jgi:hypothetical protein